MKYFIILIFSALYSLSVQAQEPPSSFNNAKKILADLHEEIGQMKTLYCGCSYERTTTSGGQVDRESCGLKARRNENRSKRIEWEHVVPASWFGNTRACWILKDKVYPEQCAGKSGRACCEAVNESFELAHNDPNNLFPSAGEINGDRSNHPYGEVSGEERVYGLCNFEIGRTDEGRIVEPGDDALRGVLARAMLYMSQEYGVDTKVDIETLWKWHEDNPPEEWEIIRATRINQITGLKNEWILGRETN